MSYLKSFVILIILLGCNTIEDSGNIQSTELDSLNLLNNNPIHSIRVVSDYEMEFINKLELYKITDLPFEVESDISLPNLDIIHNKNKKTYEMIRSLSHKPDKELIILDRFFKIKDIHDQQKILKDDYDLIESNCSLLLLERFKPINDSIEVLLMSTNLDKIVIWIIATYDKKNMKKIDNSIIGVFELSGDMYYESYLKIEKDYSINSIVSNFYESNPIYNEIDYRINPKGQIEILLAQSYSFYNDYSYLQDDSEYQGTTDNLLSYWKSTNSFGVEFHDEMEFEGSPVFYLYHYQNDQVDSSYIINTEVELFDNQNRKWLIVYAYESIGLMENNAHYKRYFYNIKTQIINNIQEVKYHILNDSIIFVAFRSGISESDINSKHFIKFNYNTNYSDNQPWFNSYFNLKTLDELKTKLTYLNK